MRPEILTHPNIPKPLHGISPRTIMGQKWWDDKRRHVYALYDYHCAACGVHKLEAAGPKWLEAHEYWNIDYMTGICKIESIEPLCHYCHAFIHSGRLAIINKSDEYKKSVIEHGFKILKKNNLQPFYFVVDLADRFNIKHEGIKGYIPKLNKNLNWSDYVLIFNGKEYRSRFNDIFEWKKHYKGGF